MTRFLPRTALLTTLASPLAALAHEGHGLAGTHWHASDAWGFVVVAALAVAAIIYFRKK